MIYNSADEIYDTIRSGKDLYDTDRGIYLFEYNEAGAIAYYYLDEDELKQLAEEVGPDDYIGAALGPGGYIIDVALKAPDGEIIGYDDQAFWEYYDKPEYILDCTDILDFLEPMVGDEIIDAMPSDLVDFGEE